MSQEIKIQRSEVYYVVFDPVFGSELGGFTMRPAVVVSINDLNRNTRLVTVVPGTDAEHIRQKHDNQVIVPADKENGLTKATCFQCHQVRAISHGRITQRAKGRISREKFKEIETALGFCLGLSLET